MTFKKQNAKICKKCGVKHYKSTNAAKNCKATYMANYRKNKNPNYVNVHKSQDVHQSEDQSGQQDVKGDDQDQESEIEQQNLKKEYKQDLDQNYKTPPKFNNFDQDKSVICSTIGSLTTCQTKKSIPKLIQNTIMWIPQSNISSDWIDYQRFYQKKGKKPWNYEIRGRIMHLVVQSKLYQKVHYGIEVRPAIKQVYKAEDEGTNINQLYIQENSCSEIDQIQAEREVSDGDSVNISEIDKIPGDFDYLDEMIITRKGIYPVKTFTSSEMKLIRKKAKAQQCDAILQIQQEQKRLEIFREKKRKMIQKRKLTEQSYFNQQRFKIHKQCTNALKAHRMPAYRYHLPAQNRASIANFRSPFNMMRIKSANETDQCYLIEMRYRNLWKYSPNQQVRRMQFLLNNCPYAHLIVTQQLRQSLVNGRLPFALKEQIQMRRVNRKKKDSAEDRQRRENYLIFMKNKVNKFLGSHQASKINTIYDLTQDLEQRLHDIDFNARNPPKQYKPKPFLSKRFWDKWNQLQSQLFVSCANQMIQIKRIALPKYFKRRPNFMQRYTHSHRMGVIFVKRANGLSEIYSRYWQRPQPITQRELEILKMKESMSKQEFRQMCRFEVMRQKQQMLRLQRQIIRQPLPPMKMFHSQIEFQKYREQLSKLGIKEERTLLLAKRAQIPSQIRNLKKSSEYWKFYAQAVQRKLVKGNQNSYVSRMWHLIDSWLTSKTLIPQSKTEKQLQMYGKFLRQTLNSHTLMEKIMNIAQKQSDILTRKIIALQQQIKDPQIIELINKADLIFRPFSEMTDLHHKQFLLSLQPKSQEKPQCKKIQIQIKQLNPEYGVRYMWKIEELQKNYKIWGRRNGETYLFAQPQPPGLFEKQYFDSQMKSFLGPKKINGKKFRFRTNIYHPSFEHSKQYDTRDLRFALKHDQQMLNAYQTGKYVLPVRYRFVNDQIGAGLDSTRNIAKNQFMGWFSGYVVPQTFADSLGDNHNMCFYAPTKKGDFVISTCFGYYSMGPMYNSAEKDPNIGLYAILTRKYGLQYVFLALRNIKQGQHLVWNYNSGDRRYKFSKRQDIRKLLNKQSPKEGQIGTPYELGQIHSKAVFYTEKDFIKSKQAYLQDEKVVPYEHTEQ